MTEWAETLLWERRPGATLAAGQLVFFLISVASPEPGPAMQAVAAGAPLPHGGALPVIPAVTSSFAPTPVIPANAGIHRPRNTTKPWIPGVR